MKKVILLFTIILFVLPLSAQFKAKMVFSTMSKERIFTVYSSGAGYRYEFNEDGQTGVIIVKTGSQHVIILMPQQKMAMKSPAESPMSMGNDPVQSYEHHKAMGVLNEVGKETVNGIACTKFELWNKENSSQKTYTVWLSEKYQFPVKMVNHIDGEEGSGMELKDVQPWTPNANSYSIPEGYQVMEMPDMMQGMGKN